MSLDYPQAVLPPGGNGNDNDNGNGNGLGNGNGNGAAAASPPVGAVLVCGGGVAGIQASLDLSAAGYRVYLVEESPTIGGGMARLDKTFPTGDCATCIISPKLVECMRDYNIDVLTMADVARLEGEAGHFKVEVRRRPRSVDASKCTGCGDCWQACPVRNVPQATEPMRPSAPLPADDAAKLAAILARHAGVPGALMPVLHDIHAAHGYLPRLVLEHLACQWNVQLAEILRVASFYDEFRFEPVGRHVVEICTGTSCYSRGSAALLERLEKELGVGPNETDKQGRFTIRTVRCLGLCALSPAMKIDGRSFGRVDIDRLPALLEQFT
jgi:NADH:ubiquinone oxidoreductase subunit E/NAD-dependent dihydropyrimidine dehydrogenase PreA subunit